MHILDNSEKLKEKGVTLIENTPQEIRDATLEQEQCIKDKIHYSNEDISLQEKFWQIIDSYSEITKVTNKKIRIGKEFISKNKYLLD